MNYLPLIYELRDHERYVYHYTKAETARDYILPSRTLRLGPFLETNDPRESRQWEFSADSLGKLDLSNYGTRELSDWLGGTLQQSARVACFCQDVGTLTGDPLREMYQRGFSRPRMWAQYAQDHRGVCLVFDRAKLIDSMRAAFAAIANTIILFYAPVEYRNHRLVHIAAENEFSVTVEDLESVGRERYPWEHLKRYWHGLFFEKAEDWRAEAEWRAVGFTTGTDPILVPVDQALAAVIHGSNISRSMSYSIIALTDTPEIEHMGLVWKNGSPWYDIGTGRWRYATRHLP